MSAIKKAVAKIQEKTEAKREDRKYEVIDFRPSVEEMRGK